MAFNTHALIKHAFNSKVENNLQNDYNILMGLAFFSGRSLKIDFKLDLTAAFGRVPVART